MTKTSKSSKTKTFLLPKKQIKSLIKVLQKNTELLEVQLNNDLECQRQSVGRQIISNKKQMSHWLNVLDSNQDLREKINRKKEDRQSVEKVKIVAEKSHQSSVKKISKNSRRKTRKNIEKLTSSLENAFKEFGQHK